jgi:hypothetical protein
MPRAHGASAQAQRKDAMASGIYLLESRRTTREASAVDLALKLNVLAVCAVFVFVGAILLGAF